MSYHNNYIANTTIGHAIKKSLGKKMQQFVPYSKATIFLFLGLRISWPEKRVGRSEKKKKFQIKLSSCRKKLHGNSSKK